MNAVQVVIIVRPSSKLMLKAISDKRLGGMASLIALQGMWSEVLSLKALHMKQYFIPVLSLRSQIIHCRVIIILFGFVVYLNIWGGEGLEQ
jgi:hypothetical protein